MTRGANICNALVAALNAVGQRDPSLFDAALAKVTDPTGSHQRALVAVKK